MHEYGIEEHLRFLGENIRCLWITHGHTQKELAKELGISVRLLSKVEHGVRSQRFTALHLIRIANLFQVKIQPLLFPHE